jgi:hypothetical protein
VYRLQRKDAVENPRQVERIPQKGKPQMVVDPSRVKYVLFRAGKSKELLELCLRLLPRNPELIDAFCAYFDNYEISRRLENQLLRIIEDGIPYDSARGEIWLTLARIASPRLMEKALPQARV